MINRFIYLGYYLKTLDFKAFRKFLRYTKAKHGKSYLYIHVDLLFSIFKYNISILEYFQFGFINKPKSERQKWAGTGFMYESINKLNPRNNRSVLSNKVEFIQTYRDFILHKSYSLSELSDVGKFDELLGSGSDKILIKNSKGQCGRGIEVLPKANLSLSSLLDKAQISGNDMVEEYVEQHEKLKELSPSGLNTLRIITQINKTGVVDILGVRLRISNNSIVDNMAAGNIAAPVDVKTGLVNGPGVFSDITKDDVLNHPVTGVSILGFKIPYFQESMELAKRAALHNIGNSSIGWDIAITDHGPGLIEGNHDWCKLLWQLPVKEGLKNKLQEYVEDKK